MTRLYLRYGYQWSKLAPQDDPKYQFLKKVAEKSALSIAGMKGAQNELVEAFCSRLRGRHGAPILEDVRTRIRSADILLFDLSDENPNVMIELGMALAQPENEQFIFILMKEGSLIPSDLSGYLISFYEETDEYNLVDPKGFYAAMRSALIQRAKRKGITLSWDSLDTQEADFSY